MLFLSIVMGSRALELNIQSAKICFAVTRVVVSYVIFQNRCGPHPWCLAGCHDLE